MTRAGHAADQARLLVEYKHQAFEAVQNESGTWTLYFVYSDAVAHRQVQGTSFALLDDNEDADEVTADDIAHALGHMIDGEWVV